MKASSDDGFAASVAANQKHLASRIGQEFDYIVCGSGSAGSVVAGRLASNPAVRVLLLEAGEDDDTSVVLDPNQWMQFFGTARDWGFQANQNLELNGRSIPYSMGKVLGGGSSVNVCTWSRGHQKDWDFYAQETADDRWNYENTLRLFHKIEDWHGKQDDRHRGTGGPVYLRPAQDPHPFFHAFLSAAESQGIARFDSPNGQMMESDGGCAFVDEIVHGNQRQSIFRSYVYPRMTQPNLTVLTRALVTKVLFEQKMAVGVEFLYQGQLVRINAAVEVVLSLGAIHTPKVLMQSGIGDKSELASFDIPLVQHLRAVGKNLHDHISLGVLWEGTEVDMPAAPRGQAVCFWKTRSDLDSPNAFTYTFPAPFLTPENSGLVDLPQNVWSMALGLNPVSRGSVSLTGAAASDPVSIDAGYLRDRQDLDDMVAAIEMAEKIGNSTPFAPFTKRGILPGPVDGVGLESYIRNGLVTFWHQSGTARMGRDEQSVVDGELKVMGVERLRIADASVMPKVTMGNIMAPCTVIGEQAAELLQAKHGTA
jgi:choline dehydrogenase